MRSIWMLVAGIIIIGAFNLRFDADVLNSLPSQLDSVKGLKLFQERFSSGQDLIIAISASSSTEAEVAAERIASQLQFHSNLVRSVTWKPQWMDHPEEVAELLAFMWFNQPPEVFSQLTNRLSPIGAPSTLRDTRERLATSLSPEEISVRAYDPFSLTQLPESVSGGIDFSKDPFSSADGRFRIISVEPKPSLAGYRECREWLASIKAIVDGIRNTDSEFRNVTTQFTGRPAFVADISTGMQRDLSGTSAVTLFIIGLLFYLTHRRILPLIYLVLLLLVILAVSTVIGGLIFGMVNVMSIGFASILLGLAEDFGIVLYQETQSNPGRSTQEIRHEAAPGIIWSAVTAAGAFLALNLSSLPGLRQLGTFVAVGILVAAAVMLAFYLPLVSRARNKNLTSQPLNPSLLLFETRRLLPPRLIWTLTVVLLIAASTTVWLFPPRFDRSPDPLRPRASEAYVTLAAVKQQLQQEEPLWVIVRGQDEADVSTKLLTLKQHLQTNVAVSRFNVPTELIPNPEYQAANKATRLISQPTLDSIAHDEGFTPQALTLTHRILANWSSAAQAPGVWWPTGNLSGMILTKVTSKSGNELLALALVYPKSRSDVASLIQSWPESFSRTGILLSGWDVLGAQIFDLVLHELPIISIPVIVLVVVCLSLAFRNIRDVLLSFSMLAFSSLMLSATASLLGWRWNILNLMAVPMLLGIGIDFSIHMQLALKRSGGDLLAVRRSVGKALLLAGATTVAGFGSLSFASNAGIASLGIACATGISIALLTSVYLLPVWWHYCHRNGTGVTTEEQSGASDRI